jgi:hypothetical protein
MLSMSLVELAVVFLLFFVFCYFWLWLGGARISLPFSFGGFWPLVSHIPHISCRAFPFGINPPNSNVVEFGHGIVVCLIVPGQLMLLVPLAVLVEGLFWGHRLQ